MNSKELSKEEKELLQYCVKEHVPKLLEDIDRLDQLNIDRINEMRNAVGDEFVSKGLEQDDEPNRYGLKLEDLIDRLADLYIWPNE
jgi:hypothetical protein